MNIGIDVMGGDFAPEAVFAGLATALPTLPPTCLLWLFGTPEALQAGCATHGLPAARVRTMPAPQVVPMGEHATKALKDYPESSIMLGMKALAMGHIDAFASAGNTGAMYVAGLMAVKPQEGITRPAISTLVPKTSGGRGLLLDVGANADCKPEHLVQFAYQGIQYATQVLQIVQPKVALMNIGEEAEKGNALTQAAHKLLTDDSAIHFVGNIEGRDLFNDKADVIVCDGFVGNIILKEAESFYDLLKMRHVEDDYFEFFNYENYGGSPILGLNKPVIVGHGISSPKAITNMILHAARIVQARIGQAAVAVPVV